MTNKEKFREKLEDFALAQVMWGLDKHGEPVLVLCGNCTMTSTEKLQWLNQEYKEPGVEDWFEVEVDTPIYVRDEDEEWLPRHFAKYEDGVVYAWDRGKTSWTANNEMIDWKYAKLADNEEVRYVK